MDYSSCAAAGSLDLTLLITTPRGSLRNAGCFFASSRIADRDDNLLPLGASSTDPRSATVLTLVSFGGALFAGRPWLAVLALICVVVGMVA